MMLFTSLRGNRLRVESLPAGGIKHTVGSEGDLRKTKSCEVGWKMVFSNLERFKSLLYSFVFFMSLNCIGSRLNLTFCGHAVVDDVDPIVEDNVFLLLEDGSGMDPVLSVVDVDNSASLGA